MGLFARIPQKDPLPISHSLHPLSVSDDAVLSNLEALYMLLGALNERIDMDDGDEDCICYTTSSILNRHVKEANTQASCL